MYSYEPFKEYQAKQDRQRSIDTFETKMNTKEAITVYKYFGNSGPITRRQKEKYRALPIQGWST